MKKYFLPILIVIVIVAAGGMALKYSPQNYSYEIRTAKDSPAPTPVLTSAPAASPSVTKEKPIVIVLSPHFDDVTLALGGFLAKSQYETEVDIFFAGKPSEDLYTKLDQASGFWDSDEAVPLRAIESKKALKNFGLASNNYNYLDFQYREKEPSSSSASGRIATNASIEKSIEKDIESIISTYSSREIYLYGPAAFGDNITNPDHGILHKAFVAEAEKNGNPDVKFLIYEDLPYASQFKEGNLGSLKDYLENYDGIMLAENDIEISQEESAKKTKAIGDYVSQVTAFQSQGTDIASLAASFNRSRCKTSRPDWYACEVVYAITD